MFSWSEEEASELLHKMFLLFPHRSIQVSPETNSSTLSLLKLFKGVPVSKDTTFSFKFSRIFIEFQVFADQNITEFPPAGVFYTTFRFIKFH